MQIIAFAVGVGFFASHSVIHLEILGVVIWGLVDTGEYGLWVYLRMLYGLMIMGKQQFMTAFHLWKLILKLLIRGKA